MPLAGQPVMNPTPQEIGFFAPDRPLRLAVAAKAASIAAELRGALEITGRVLNQTAEGKFPVRAASKSV